ncbi:hypothetical protein GPECTOR_85g353 [Gonium pectorale]|uniref:Ankyrin repeat domain-containing protein n=1 Tax=Gonium pectorale TaxID=33097 RepID=A0A150G182_GONPE|nr:hypothetical protein GPECTOR_85g353 [Gonium pectorale]|eukprot:KXZ43623.1 hypothetical protein GPECTOR_85g353 [Gonium pectorale]
MPQPAAVAAEAPPPPPQPLPLRRHWYCEILEASARSVVADWRAKVEWLEALPQPPGYERHSDVCNAAAGRPDALERLRWLRSRGFPVSCRSAWAAARAGNVAALEYVLAEGVHMEEDLATLAAKEGRLEVLAMLHARSCPMDPMAVASQAAEGGHLAVLAWAVEALGVDVAAVPGLADQAASTGNVELVAWLRGRGCAWSEDTFLAVAESGCEEALELLVAGCCPMGENGEPYLAAARNSDPHTLHVLQRLGCPWGPAGRVFTAYLKCCWRGSALTEASAPHM